MAYQGINTGSYPNSGDGDTLLASALKINSNFQELYGKSQLGIDETKTISNATLTGVTTISGIRVSSGTIIASSFYGDGENITGIRSSTNAYFAEYANMAQKSVYSDNSGVSTNSYNSVNSTNVVGGIASVSTLTVSGVSTLGNLLIDSGIVTARSGIVTYYGDGSNLSGVNSKISIFDGGGIVADNVSSLKFIGNCVSSIEYSSGISTVDISISSVDYSNISGVSTYSLVSGLSTNIVGGNVGDIPYQSSPNTTEFIGIGTVDYVLTSNGPSIKPSWRQIVFPPSMLSGGIQVLENNSPTGISSSIDFVGTRVSATTSNGISTITIDDNTGYSIQSGLSSATNSLETPRSFQITGDILSNVVSFDGTSNVTLDTTIQPNSVILGDNTTGKYVGEVVGTTNQIEVITDLNEGGTAIIGLSSNIDNINNINSTGIITADNFSGSGANLTGVVTSIIAGNNISVSNSSGQVLISAATTGANLTDLNASNLSSGTIPDARFPTTLPAVSGANLTNLNASNLSSGTIPDARFPTTLPAVSGANLTGVVTSIIAGNNISVSNSSGQVLISASPTRTTVSGTTSTILPNSAVNLDITGYKAYTLLKITVSGPSWVVLYTDTNSRSNDSSRDSLTDPLPGSGIIAEIYTETTGSSTFLMSPGVIGWNNSSPISNTIFAKVKNTGLSSAAITVTLTVIPMEE